MTGRDRLLQVAPLLWGRRWQAEMAEDLRASPRTLRRYVNGERAVDPGLLAKLEAALLVRLSEIAEALDVPERMRAGLRIEIDYVKGYLEGK